MIFNLSKVHSSRRLVVCLRLLFVLLLLAGCTEIDSPEGAAVGAKSSIGLGQAPDILSRAVDPVQLRPIVTMNGVVVSAERASDGSWFVDYTLFDSSLEIEMSWVENYNGQDLTLASWSGNFANIASSSSFIIPVAEYDSDSHDHDGDGTSNLAERMADSDPYVRPFSSTDIIGVWVGPCNVGTNGFDFGQLAITFGPASYQLSFASYGNPEGCTGTNYVTVNLLGSYFASGETTELDDGVAYHLDITHRNGTISAGDDFIDALDSIGTTLQDIYTAEGIENINDVSLEELSEAGDREIPDRIFTIYRIEGDQFFEGAETILRNGTNAERRHNILSVEETYTKL